ncbi:MAG TPA: hypothetical protein VN081_03165 [Dongiaceae bacterium]|nr:hypothetical protein [Dongiaceae bacterium]
MRFKIYWLDGSSEVVSGDTVADGMTNAGYGRGAVSAIDWYEPLEGNSREASRTKELVFD